VIAIPKEEQKVKTLVNLTKLGLQSSLYPSRKSLRKSSRSSLSLLLIKTPKILVKITIFGWNSRRMKILTKI
jgi:hypothetical protein